MPGLVYDEGVQERTKSVLKCCVRVFQVSYLKGKIFPGIQTLGLGFVRGQRLAIFHLASFERCNHEDGAGHAATTSWRTPGNPVLAEALNANQEIEIVQKELDTSFNLYDAFVGRKVQKVVASLKTVRLRQPTNRPVLSDCDPQSQGFIRTLEDSSRNAHQTGLVRAVLAAAFYPQFGQFLPPPKGQRFVKLLTASQEKVGPSSVAEYAS